MISKTSVLGLSIDKLSYEEGGGGGGGEVEFAGKPIKVMKNLL